MSLQGIKRDADPFYWRTGNMTLSTIEFAKAREVIKQLLDELKLDAYLFEVEPDENTLEIKVECAVEGGWETVTIPAEKVLLLRAIDDIDTYQSLMEQWRGRLSTCLTST
jgi:hypothetical protein